MGNLSYTQEFYLCAVNRKGNIPTSFWGHPYTCLVVGSITELLDHGYITKAEKDKFVICKEWDDSLPYLKPLYEKIAIFNKPLNIKEIASVYVLGFNSKPLIELLSAIGVSLVESGYADEMNKRGLLKEKIKYVPKSEAAKRVIEKIRAEILEDGTIADETLYLTTMLDKSGIIYDYFSKVETGDMKKRIKEVQASEAYASVKEALDYIEWLIVDAT